MIYRHLSQHRIERHRASSLQVCSDDQFGHTETNYTQNAVIDCGWGRLVFAHTFEDSLILSKAICDEPEDKRNIALYIKNPHVVLAQAPQDLFLDPSHTYRMWFSDYHSSRIRPVGYRIRKLNKKYDYEAVNQILSTRHMVTIDEDFLKQNKGSKTFTYFVAEDLKDNSLLGVITGVDHKEAFGDPENGSSLWCLAVDPKCSYSGVGRTLVAYIADHYATRGRAYLDLSVMHDNKGAIGLYEAMGFQQVPVFCIKKKNTINEQLFIGPRPEDQLNPYAKIIVDEARRRGISVEVLDTEQGYFRLALGARTIVCRESLSELTTAIAMSRCDNKRLTCKILKNAGLHVPAQHFAGDKTDNQAFLQEWEHVVVKPLCGEQGQGVQVNISDTESMTVAIKQAHVFSDQVLIEQFVRGQDLRIIVIDYKVVAAAVRKPPIITGNGQDNIKELIVKQSRRRAAATEGESRIPLDDETARCIANAGFSLHDILPAKQSIVIRENANLHTGGTIHDVTPQLSNTLRAAAERAARCLNIPVVGFDFIVDDIKKDDYVIIEANERPGLANHEPQPTAECFIDLLFPQTISA